MLLLRSKLLGSMCEERMTSCYDLSKSFTFLGTQSITSFSLAIPSLLDGVRLTEIAAQKEMMALKHVFYV